MVKLRLKRIGKKKHPCYQIIAIDSRRKRDGSYLEKIGHYYPISNKHDLDQEKAIKWLNFGAKPTLTVLSLFKKNKIMKTFYEQKNSTVEKK